MRTRAARGPVAHRSAGTPAGARRSSSMASRSGKPEPWFHYRTQILKRMFVLLSYLFAHVCSHATRTDACRSAVYSPDDSNHQISGAHHERHASPLVCHSSGTFATAPNRTNGPCSAPLYDACESHLWHDWQPISTVAKNGMVHAAWHETT